MPTVRSSINSDVTPTHGTSNHQREVPTPQRKPIHTACYPRLSPLRRPGRTQRHPTRGQHHGSLLPGGCAAALFTALASVAFPSQSATRRGFLRVHTAKAPTPRASLTALRWRAFRRVRSPWGSLSFYVLCGLPLGEGCGAGERPIAVLRWLVLAQREGLPPLSPSQPAHSAPCPTALPAHARSVKIKLKAD